MTKELWEKYSDVWEINGSPVMDEEQFYKALFDYRELMLAQQQVKVEPEVKPACINCKHLCIEKISALLRDRAELCQNPELRLWNLTNCDIDITKFGCTYFESKSV